MLFIMTKEIYTWHLQAQTFTSGYIDTKQVCLLLKLFVFVFTTHFVSGSEKNVLSVLPNQCISFKRLGMFDCIPNTVDQHENHRLYRKDTYYRHDKSTSTYKIESYKLNKRLALCPYYRGRYVTSDMSFCEKPICISKNKSMSLIQARDYKLKIISVISFYRHTKVEAEVVEYPSGTGFGFINEEWALQFEQFIFKSFMTSTFYHINCSQTIEKIARWSNLNLTLIKEICLNEKTEVLLKNNVLEYQLLPPYPANEHSNIWKLVIFFSQCSQNVDNYGSIVFKTQDPKRLCDRNKIMKIQHLLLVKFEKIPQCSTRKIYTHLNSKLVNSTGKLELGFQIFDASIITYYPNISLEFNINICKLHYKWIKDEKVKDSNFRKFKKTLKLLKYFDKQFSWQMAAATCKENKMTLPHFSTERIMKQFVSYILNEFSLPTYLVFIGLSFQVKNTLTVFQKNICFYSVVHLLIFCLLKEWESKVDEQ